MSIVRNNKSVHRKEFATLTEMAERGDDVVGFTEKMLALAFVMNVTDVHISVTRERISFREKGKLVKRFEPSVEFLSNVISRVTVLAKSDKVTCKTIFHGGSFDFEAAEKENRIDKISCRLSVFPNVSGQKAVIRLRGASSPQTLTDLGFPDEMNEKLYLWLIRRYLQGGLFILVGPTGSGKSTTLNALSDAIFKEGGRSICVLTIEDPVEVVNPDFEQLEVNLPADITPEKAIKEALRQDPDVMLIGEVRNAEMARLACEISETGHLVLTTLHANDVVSAINRLRSLGISDYVIASLVIGIASQRLMQVLCPKCKEEYSLSDEDKRYLFKKRGFVIEKSFLASEGGCPTCKYTGVVGKIPVFEVLFNTKGTRAAILGGGNLEDSAEIRERQTMLDHALDLFEVLSFEEIKRVLVEPEEYEKLSCDGKVCV